MAKGVLGGFRGKTGSMATKHVGGTPRKVGSSEKRGKTKPSDNGTCNLAAYANRRCAVKKG